MKHRVSWIAILALQALLLGCAANPAKKSGSGEYSALYDGEMGVAHEAGSSSESSAKEAVARGDQAFSGGNLDKALFEYVKALEIGGGDAAVLDKVGAIQTLQGNFPLAEKAYTTSLDLEPNDATALEGIGLIALTRHQYSEAKAYLARSIVNDSNRWRAHNGLGLIADLQNKHEMALEHYSKALLVKPTLPQLHNNIGYSYYLAGDLDESLRYFRVALNYNPRFERAWHNIGLVYTVRGEYDSALKAFRRVMDTAEAYNNIGYICMINGEYDDAEAYLKEAIDHSASYYVKAHENLDEVKRLRARSAGRASDSTPEGLEPRTADVYGRKYGHKKTTPGAAGTSAKSEDSEKRRHNEKVAGRSIHVGSTLAVFDGSKAGAMGSKDPVTSGKRPQSVLDTTNARKREAGVLTLRPDLEAGGKLRTGSSGKSPLEGSGAKEGPGEEEHQDSVKRPEDSGAAADDDAWIEREVMSRYTKNSFDVPAKYVVTGTNVTLHALPKIESDVKLSLRGGQEVQEFEILPHLRAREGQWVRVEVLDNNHALGWIQSSHLTPLP